ncbi:MAG TPA: helix-turn-helix transcriptional regulator [Thermoanaerobaculia bacterium]|nr:helix-turn-helix transcriptional regulator [Thermoanaerobaculia bacterium]
MEGEVLKGHLEMLLLSIIDGGARHGYAIIEALRERSGGAFELPEGTIYPALHRLEERALVRSAWTEAGRRRRVYELTREGRAALARQRQDWAAFSAAVRSVLAG